MNTLNKIIGVLIIILLTSCTSKFLTVTPKDELTDANFFLTGADAEAALVGAYGQLQEESTFGNVVDAANLDWTMSGDLYEQDQNTPRVQLEMLSLPANNLYIGQMYTGLYRGVARANFVIGRVAKMTGIDAIQQGRIIAEAKFLRAIYYYKLVTYFGGVPLVVEELNASSKLDIPRASAADVWAQIITDLKDAAAVLPVTWTNTNDVGRATKGSALAYLAKSYLWRQNWDDAIKASEEIVNSNAYELLTDFRSVFLETNENNKEMVFSTQYGSMSNGIEGNQLDVRSAPRGAAPEFIGRGANSNFVPQTNWINAFEKGPDGKIKDKRYWGVIIGPGEHHQEMTDFVMPLTFPNSYTKTGYIVTKYWQKANIVNSGLNAPIVRYAEVLLNYAEALNEKGRSEDAMKLVNKIRERAGLDAKPLSLSREQTLDAIFYERRMEFVWEPAGAFQDLNRRNRFMDFIRANRADYDKINVQSKPWLNERPILLPIPLGAWDVNKALVQNPGYPAF
ncbi:tetratricopeptide (TPR) repeat protein [Chitinophaga terrae (ex Kim and Jung 2007)]|uniref:RagB/SusD family nutrient uptake outer membrane protein n=1 Tax=Chitinophaga terrae (ex Kim and Jung 2007) TaxID=408074 RepID=UPI0027876758|nr:RagB/SusD family nutrient uptake outer membrane protein [Chitinophaga terrae (ex Kim and Jung 2007)]MDQ0106812.1 tetratricopeptide (TPR) repeat protein [Chitinophaga terrae (ex Kim and Jung 2007)]